MFLLQQTFKILESGSLSRQGAYDLQQAILAGNVSTPHLVGLFQLMSNRLPTKDEMLGFIQASREVATSFSVDYDVIDTSGTGGDNLQTFNISTASAFVLAALGVKVAKYGNRAISSKCGAADVLEALDVKIDLPVLSAQKILNEVGMVFLWAPLYQPSFRHVKEARTVFQKVTYFNFLEPLLNPAGAKYQLIGVSDIGMMHTMGEVLMELGSQHILLVHSSEGMDEISPSGITHCVEYITRDVALNETESDLERFALEKHLTNDPYLTREFTINPHLAKLKVSLADIQGGSIKKNKQIIQDILENRGSDGHVTSVLLNAAAGLMVMGKAADFDEGIRKAAEVLQNGTAKQILDKLIAATKNG